jgi:osmotically-inducible protein OsmY
MNRLKSTYTLALASVVAGVLAGCADFRASEPPKDSPDAKITADVQAQLNRMADLGPPGSIRVQTVGSVVYLNGLVDGGLAKHSAESAVRQLPGVQQVVDGIDVEHGD